MEAAIMHSLDNYLRMANGHLSDIEKNLIPKYMEVDVASVDAALAAVKRCRPDADWGAENVVRN
jgi:hypothetical protein